MSEMKVVGATGGVSVSVTVGVCCDVVSDTKPLVDLESLFFDLETEMENNDICRDQICLSQPDECRE